VQISARAADPPAEASADAAADGALDAAVEAGASEGAVLAPPVQAAMMSAIAPLEARRRRVPFIGDSS
jgi:hypothetical protein